MAIYVFSYLSSELFFFGGGPGRQPLAVPPRQLICNMLCKLGYIVCYILNCICINI